ncbi:MAG: RNA-binding protein [Gammaproteobacteria bacterium]|nr:MAG: RNA-binding protein [Gammaproteobacteria bacterium]
MNIYVGNISWEMEDDDLNKEFSKFGEVSTASVIKRQFDGRSKGFAFVEMDDDDAAKAAIEALDGAEVMGRNIKVNEARPKKF